MKSIIIYNPDNGKPILFSTGIGNEIELPTRAAVIVVENTELNERFAGNTPIIGINLETLEPIFEPIVSEKSDAEKVAEYEAILKANGITV